MDVTIHSNLHGPSCEAVNSIEKQETPRRETVTVNSDWGALMLKFPIHPITFLENHGWEERKFSG